ncbi:MAG: hypothetical protein COB81_08325 [Flavobacteriaceae bacterium]|nr:MAG: hypothetical protein COB81_08325 [Flavobacteriaceae bacterium]
MKATGEFRNEDVLFFENSFNRRLLQKIEQVITAEDTVKANTLIQAYESYKNMDLSDVWADEEELLHYLKAKNFVKEQNYLQAFTEINKAIASNKKFDNELAAIYATDHYNLKGQIELILGNYNDAIKSFEFVQESPACCCELKAEMESMILELERLIEA